MNTLHLKYALEVEKTRSITQAADNLFTAQPNLSRAIRELEDSVGFPIFERNPKGVAPTQLGSEFLTHAKKILSEVRFLESLGAAEVKQPRFSISIPRGSYIADGITQFVRELDGSGNTQLYIQETNSMQAIANVTSGEFDLGIIRYQTEYETYFSDYLSSKRLKSEPIWEFDCMAVMAADHPLAKKKFVTPEDLSAYPEITHGDTVIPYLNSEPPEKHEKGQKIYVYERSTQFDLLEHVSGTYMWVSSIPRRFLKKYNLVQIPCKGEGRRYKDVLIHSPSYCFTDLDKLFLDKLFLSKNEVAFHTAD